MEERDLKAVQNLLDRYLAKFDIAPVFDTEELNHWLIGDEKAKEKVVWTYVVEVRIPPELLSSVVRTKLAVLNRSPGSQKLSSKLTSIAGPRYQENHGYVLLLQSRIVRHR